jgi:UDP-N-acetyl-D-glucosamine dehydrogenase
LTDFISKLHEAISSKQATIGVIGLGYVGLPLADALHSGDLSILGFDVDESKIISLDKGENYLKHLGSDLTVRLSNSNRFSATTDFGRLREVDVIIVCVPTPVGAHLEPDLSYVLESARVIGDVLVPGQMVILESTTYPRTTKDEFLPAILNAANDANRGDFTVGENLFVAFSPEREDPGRKSHSTTTIPKLVGGVDPASTDLAAAVYECGVDTVVKVASAEIAEAAKILENVFRSVNIAMVNELKILFDAMDIDVWEVIKAASTKPFGFMPFYPGPGLGGHCIPIDPYYLTWKAREHNRVTRFIELAGEINRGMPEYVLSKVASALNDDKKAVNGSNILVIGLAYKPNIDDTRETPAAELIEILAKAGGMVSYHDPHVPVFPPMRNYRFTMESVDLNKSTLAATDCVVIVTNHDVIDYDLIGAHSKLVVDTRNAMESVTSPKAKIVKA